jgi:UDP-N-acetylmuramyl tripeptide synthase
LEAHSDTVILTAVADYLDADAATAACDIGSCFATERETKIVPNRAEAVALGLSEARSGDTVLIFGHGAHVENSETFPFCDRLFTKQWLYENQVCDLIP